MFSIWLAFRRSSARGISLVRSLDQRDTGPRRSDRGKGRLTRSISIRIAGGQCTIANSQSNARLNDLSEALPPQESHRTEVTVEPVQSLPDVLLRRARMPGLEQ